MPITWRIQYEIYTVKFKGLCNYRIVHTTNHLTAQLGLFLNLAPKVLLIIRVNNTLSLQNVSYEVLIYTFCL